MLNNDFTTSPSSRSTNPETILEFQAHGLICEIADLLDIYAGKLVKAQTGFDYAFDVDRAKDKLVIELLEFLFQGAVSNPEDCVKAYQIEKHHVADWYGFDFDMHSNLIVPNDWDESDEEVV